MRFTATGLAGALALAIATTAGAQAQRATPAQPASPPDQQATQAQPATTPTTTMPDEPGTPQGSAPGQTGMTPGQQQTSPGQASEITPAQTGTAPSGQTTGNPSAAQLTAATAADLTSGASVYDQKGAVVGKIDSVTADGAVINTGKVKAEIPLSSIAKSDKGLVISMSKSEIDAAAKKKGGK